MPREFGYMESLAEIAFRRATGRPQSRPITYQGVDFRSRLEVRFAQHLSDRGERWAYEPRTFGPNGRRYLPDFELLGIPRPTFIEVKPTIREAIAARRRVVVIWDTHPDALLLTAAAEGCTFSAGLRGQPWETWQERWV